MPLERIAGFPTWWEETGTGVRRTLFIHCSLAHSGAWAGVQGRLANRLKMRAFDRPGHGKSGIWGGQGGSAGLHDLSARIAAALIDKRADVIGHSFGATIALRLAQTQPGKVRSLTMIEPVLTSAAKGHPDYPAYIQNMQAFSVLLAADRRMDAARLFNDMVSPEAPFDALPELMQQKLAQRIHLIRDEGGVTLDDVTHLLAPGNLEAVKQPVLLMEGGNSPWLMHQINNVLASQLPQARRVVVAGAGHMSPITHPEAVAGEIAAFLKL